MRTNADATLQAGWQRAAGTALGAACGLAGAALLHVHGLAPAATLGIVAVLAFATASWPTLRSAPIAALIVLSGASVVGVSAWQVAWLRVAEMGVGVGAGLFVAWAARWAGAVPDTHALCAGLLRQLAQQLTPQETSGANGTDDMQKEARAIEVRAAVRRLGTVVHGSRQDRDRVLLQLSTRLTQDVAMLSRALRESGQADTAPVARQAAAALARAADRIEGGLTAADPVGPQATHVVAGAPTAFAVDPAGWLHADLARLVRVAARPR
jgi:uncharacterized membrane protein YgaE (UPF0421/DUF939 family)